MMRYLRAAAFTALGLVAGCDNFLAPKSKYADKSVSELISMVSSPKDAQQYIDDLVDYRKLNYIPSFHKTEMDKYGDCVAGSVAIAAMLQDNGYPSYLLRVAPSVGESHIVFAWQDRSTGLWRSAGINKDDFLRESVYGDSVYAQRPRPVGYASIEDLAKATSKRMGYDYTGYILQDVSYIDLVHGNSFDEVHIPEACYAEERSADGTLLKSRALSPTDSGFKSVESYDAGDRGNAVETTFYTNKSVLEGRRMERDENRDGLVDNVEQWRRLELYPSGDVKRTAVRSEEYLNGVLTNSKVGVREYANKKIWRSTYDIDENGDGVVDKKTQMEQTSQGIVSRVDYNCDGVWDEEEFVDDTSVE